MSEQAKTSPKTFLPIFHNVTKKTRLNLPYDITLEKTLVDIKPMLKAYRNQPINVQLNSMNWFLYDHNIGLTINHIMSIVTIMSIFSVQIALKTSN